MKKNYESPVGEVISFTSLEQMAALDPLDISLAGSIDVVDRSSLNI